MVHSSRHIALLLASFDVALPSGSRRLALHLLRYRQLRMIRKYWASTPLALSANRRHCHGSDGTTVELRLLTLCKNAAAAPTMSTQTMIVMDRCDDRHKASSSGARTAVTERGGAAQCAHDR